MTVSWRFCHLIFGDLNLFRSSDFEFWIAGMRGGREHTRAQPNRVVPVTPFCPNFGRFISPASPSHPGPLTPHGPDQVQSKRGLRPQFDEAT